MRSFTAEQLKQATEILGLSNEYQLQQLLTRKGEISIPTELMVEIFQTFVDPCYIFEQLNDKRARRPDRIKVFKMRHYDDKTDCYIDAFLVSETSGQAFWPTVRFATSPAELVACVEEKGFFWDGLLLRHEFGLPSEVPPPEKKEKVKYRVLIQWITSHPQEMPAKFRYAWATQEGVSAEFKTVQEAETCRALLCSSAISFPRQPIICHLRQDAFHNFEWCKKSWPKNPLEKP